MFTNPPCRLQPVSIITSVTSITLSPTRRLSTYTTLRSRRTLHPHLLPIHHAALPRPSTFRPPPPPPPTPHASITTATRIIHNPRVNPPASTLPPPLVLPTRSPDQGPLSYYFSLGRAYLAFYKTGLKAVYSNHLAARKITASLPPGTPAPRAASDGLLTRSDFQLLRRSRHDLVRIPLFALVVCVFGEFTPLVVLVLSDVVPRTCKIPRQVAAARERAERRRSVSFRSAALGAPGAASVSAAARAGAEAGGGRSPAEEVAGLGREQVLHVGRSLGLFGRWWDRVGLGPPGGLVRGRVRRWVEYLDLDDLLIRRDGGVEAMEVEEVRFALEERGLDVLGKNDGQLKGLLKSWLRERERVPVMRLLLTRPSVWAKEK